MQDAPSVPGYDLGEVLGSGASSTVWRARPTGGGSEVAVKLVRAGEGAEREVTVLRALRHEHVVPLRDCVTTPDGSLALVLDVVEGGTLAQLVAARGHLRPGEVVTVVAPLAATLADLHERGIQHGDLAPGNVLFDREGKPLLGDLGTVRITGEVREEAFGTPGYVDPAVVAGGAPGPSSDVYGLGALAWFALTGRTPPVALLREPLATVVAGLPDGLVAAVEEALDPDPARRPDPAALARRVFDAVPAEPVWLVGRAPADGGLTHRIRQLAAADQAAGSTARHRALRRPHRAPRALAAVVRERVGGRGPRRRRWLGAIVVATLLTVGMVAAPRLVAGVQRSRAASERVAQAGHVAAVNLPDVGASRAEGVAAEGVAAEAVTLPPAAAPPATGAPSASVERSAPALTPEQARQVVEQLSDERAAAFSGASVDLARITAPGSAAEATLRDALAGLQRAGLVYRGLRLTTRAVSVRGAAPRSAAEAADAGSTTGDGGGGQVVVDVVTDVSAYEVVDRQGRVRQRISARSGTTSRLVLVRTRAGWRVAATQA